MKAPKCVECGKPMLEAYTRDGLRLLVCGRVRAKRVAMGQATIYCIKPQ